MNLTRPQVERPGQVLLPVLPWRWDFDLRALEHPLVTDFGEQMNVELIDPEEGFITAQALDGGASPCEFAGPFPGHRLWP
jgi:hypothetical protein